MRLDQLGECTAQINRSLPDRLFIELPTAQTDRLGIPNVHIYLHVAEVTGTQGG